VALKGKEDLELIWASPIRADTLILRDLSFSHSILLEFRRAPVAQSRV
jgi:hypothetical protein